MSTLAETAEHIPVRLRTSIAGEPSYAFGQIVSLPPDIARAWIADGIAEAAPADAIEAAVSAATVETAVRHAQRRGRVA